MLFMVVINIFYFHLMFIFQPTSVDVLKQRAERFGGSVSTVMSSLENQEKLEKRKARFGAVSSTNGATISDSEKAKQQRLERFKQPAS